MDGQNGVEIREAMLNAIDNLVYSNEKTSPYDRTFLGRVKSVKGNNKYDVIINSKTYIDILGIKSFEVSENDIVYCIAPQGNMNLLRVLFSLSKDLKNIQEIKKAIVDNTKAILSKQDKLQFDTTPLANSQNPVTSNGIFNAINNTRRVVIYQNQPASKTIWDYTVILEANLSFPKGIVFGGITLYGDYVCTYYPLAHLQAINTLLMGYRDCYINFKDMRVIYDGGSLKFKATLKGQDGWQAETQEAYIIW